MLVPSSSSAILVAEEAAPFGPPPACSAATAFGTKFEVDMVLMGFTKKLLVLLEFVWIDRDRMGLGDREEKGLWGVEWLKWKGEGEGGEEEDKERREKRW